MSANPPTLVFIPGSWHNPACYDKVVKILRKRHGIKCVYVTLPSTSGNPNATFKDDLDAARSAVSLEILLGLDVVVVAHSYGGIVGGSVIKGLAQQDVQSPALDGAQVRQSGTSHVRALVLIASGFTITGLSFMDPLFGIPPPSWRANKETGFAELVTSPRELFYHDLPADEAQYWVAQLTPQSLKALFEGGEHVYAGWRDVPTWYIGTVEDRGLPVVLQRMQVGMARGQGGVVHHRELQSSHSPFLSMPEEVVSIILEAAGSVSGTETPRTVGHQIPIVELGAPGTWLRIGLPMAMGRILGWCIAGFTASYKMWKKN